MILKLKVKFIEISVSKYFLSKIIKLSNTIRKGDNMNLQTEKKPNIN